MDRQMKLPGKTRTDRIYEVIRNMCFGIEKVPLADVQRVLYRKELVGTDAWCKVQLRTLAMQGKIKCDGLYVYDLNV